MTFVLTGLDQQAKADWVREQLFIRLGGEDRFDEVDVPLRARAARRARPGGRVGPAARQRQERRRAPRRAGVLVRGHRAGAGQLSRLLHHLAARSGAGVRRVLAGAGAAPTIVHHVVVHADGRRETVPVAAHRACRATDRAGRRRRRARSDPAPGEPLGTRVRRPLRRQGRQRQRRHLGPRRRRLRLARAPT